VFLSRQIAQPLKKIKGGGIGSKTGHARSRAWRLCLRQEPVSQKYGANGLEVLRWVRQGNVQHSVLRVAYRELNFAVGETRTRAMECNTSQAVSINTTILSHRGTRQIDGQKFSPREVGCENCLRTQRRAD